jgi:hypothetical protein
VKVNVWIVKQESMQNLLPLRIALIAHLERCPRELRVSVPYVLEGSTFQTTASVELANSVFDVLSDP